MNNNYIFCRVRLFVIWKDWIFPSRLIITMLNYILPILSLDKTMLDMLTIVCLCTNTRIQSGWFLKYRTSFGSRFKEHGLRPFSAVQVVRGLRQLLYYLYYMLRIILPLYTQKSNWFVSIKYTLKILVSLQRKIKKHDCPYLYVIFLLSFITIIISLTFCLGQTEALHPSTRNYKEHLIYE